jgi:hypothetical protein
MGVIPRDIPRPIMVQQDWYVVMTGRRIPDYDIDFYDANCDHCGGHPSEGVFRYKGKFICFDCFAGGRSAPAPEDAMTGFVSKGRGPNMSIISYKGTPAYASWCRRFAAALRLTKAEMMEEALRRLAERHEYEPPPPRDGDQGRCE